AKNSNNHFGGEHTIAHGFVTTPKGVLQQARRLPLFHSPTGIVGCSSRRRRTLPRGEPYQNNKSEPRCNTGKATLDSQQGSSVVRSRHSQQGSSVVRSLLVLLRNPQSGSIANVSSH